MNSTGILQKLIDVQEERAINHRVIQHLLFGLMHGDSDMINECLHEGGKFLGMGKTQFLAQYMSWLNALRKDEPLINLNTGLALSDLPGEVVYEIRFVIGRTLEDQIAAPQPRLGIKSSDNEHLFRIAIRIEERKIVELVDPQTFCEHEHLFPADLQFGMN